MENRFHFLYDFFFQKTLNELHSWPLLTSLLALSFLFNISHSLPFFLLFLFSFSFFFLSLLSLITGLLPFVHILLLYFFISCLFLLSLLHAALLCIVNQVWVWSFSIALYVSFTLIHFIYMFFMLLVLFCISCVYLCMIFNWMEVVVFIFWNWIF